MNFAEKNALITRANERRIGISDEKGPEYTGEAASYKAQDANILTNFYVRAERAKASVFTVAQVYAGKHIDSIETALAELAKAGSIDARVAIVRKGEGLVSRLDDLRNYCDLLECILMEEGIHPEKLDMQKIADYKAGRINWAQDGRCCARIAMEGSAKGEVSEPGQREGGVMRFFRDTRRDTLRLKSAGKFRCCGDPGDCNGCHL